MYKSPPKEQNCNQNTFAVVASDHVKYLELSILLFDFQFVGTGWAENILDFFIKSFI